MEIISSHWQDYKIIDAGDGEKLEIWKNHILRRPDPACLWPKDTSITQWTTADAIYHRSHSGGGSWQYRHSLPDSWTIQYRDMILKVSPTGFKHTGIFPEQADNWDWIRQRIATAQRPVKILNLFAYTGAATMASALAGAEEIVHVDAAKGMVAWAKENASLNHLEQHHIRYIVDDAVKFVNREHRRGRIYQGIIMDPPSYGRGPDGEIWKLEDKLPDLITACLDILDPHPLFFLVNSYTTGYTTVSLHNLLKLTLGQKYPDYALQTGTLCLPIQRNDLLLPCGITGRFFYDDSL